jgi:hypothetical protein
MLAWRMPAIGPDSQFVHPGEAPGADLLIVVTPGIERFGYFRLLARLAQGQATLDELLTAQDRYDNHFMDSPGWQAART